MGGGGGAARDSSSALAGAGGHGAVREKAAWEKVSAIKICAWEKV
jgi:hypothetical protein